MMLLSCSAVGAGDSAASTKKNFWAKFGKFRRNLVKIWAKVIKIWGKFV